MKKIARVISASLCLSFSMATIFSQASVDSSMEKKIQESLELTIDKAVEYALLGNTSVKQGNLSLEQKKRQADHAWNSVLPSIRASASISKTLSEQNNPASFSLGGSVNIGLSPSIYTSIKSAQLNYEMQESSYEATLRSVELNVRKLFYSLLYEKENLDLLQTSVNNTQTQYNNVQTKYRNGLVSQNDVLSSQINWQNSQINLEVAKGNHQGNLATFKQVLGIPQSTELILKGNLEDVTKFTDFDLTKVSGNSSNVSSVEKQLELAKIQLLATRFAAWGPSLSAGYSYNAGGNTETGLKSNNYGTLSLSVSIPLDGYLPWSNGSQSIQNQLDNITKLEMDLEDAKVSSDINIETYLKKIRQCQSNIELRKKSVDLAQQSYNMVSQAYSRGTKDLTALQNSLASLENARMNLKSETMNLANAILELENVLGVPFGTFTNSVNTE